MEQGEAGHAGHAGQAGHPEALVGAAVVVTGAGGGIGEAVATAFAGQGARVVVADVDEARTAAVAETLRRAGCEATGVAVDVTLASDVDRLFARVTSVLGRLDVLVNNAGVVSVASFDDVTVETWRRVFAVNCEGPLLTIQRAACMMREQTPHPVTGCRGKILNVSSGAAEHGRPYLAAYGASKAALNHLSATAALTFAGDEIATSVLYPGNVREGMWRDLGRQLADVEGRPVDEVEAERRFQPASEFARVAIEVASTPGMVLNGAIVDTTNDEVVVR